MESILNVSEDILDRKVETASLTVYIEAIDPERHLWTDPANVAMLVPLLEHCGYQTIRQLHESVKVGWARFCRYEMDHQFQGQLSGSLAILYAILIADSSCRKKIATRKEYEELESYLKT